MSGVAVSRIGDRVVAVHEADPGTPDAERLLNAAATLGRVSHPCVVELVEVQTEPTVRLATGFVSTDSWADHPPPADEAVARFAQLCSVLADLHESGIVHGALESRHVLVCGDGRSVVCGFGDSGPATQESVARDLAALADVADELASARPGRPIAALESVSRDLRRGRLGARTATLRLDRMDQRSAADGTSDVSLRSRLAGVSAPRRLGLGGRGSLRKASGLRRGRSANEPDPVTMPDDTAAESRLATARGTAAHMCSAHTAADVADLGRQAAGRAAGLRAGPGSGAAENGWRRRLVRVSPALAGLGGLAVLGLAVVTLTGDRDTAAVPSSPSPGTDQETPITADGSGSTADGSGSALPGSIAATAPADGAVGVGTAGSAAGTAGADGNAAAAEDPEPGGGAQPQAHETAAGTPEVEHNGRRYAVGRPGDLVLLGDWSCDGTKTPAVLRPASGEVAVFARWPTAGSALRPDLVEIVQGAIDLAVDEATACDRLRIHTPDGSRLLTLEEP